MVKIQHCRFHSGDTYHSSSLMTIQSLDRNEKVKDSIVKDSEILSFMPFVLPLLPITASCDTAWNRTWVCSDASSTEMQCLDRCATLEPLNAHLNIVLTTWPLTQAHLQVAVYDAHVMEVFDSIQDLLNELAGIFLCVKSLLHNPIKQLPTRHPG